MKRMIWIALAALLLCGCAQTSPEDTAPASTETLPPLTEATEPVGIYEAFSDLEIQTGGTVRSYQPGPEDVYGMRLMGGDVLIFSGTQTTTLTRYTGEKLYPIGQITLDCWIAPEDASFQITDHGITFFQEATQHLIFLDNDLKEVSRLELPPDLQGKPVLSMDRTQIYYCTADAVRVLDTTAGLDKLLKSISYPYQTVCNMLLNDSILRCDLIDDHGRTYAMFLSTLTGELVAEHRRSLELTSDGPMYFASAADGLLQQVLFGQKGQDVQVLYPADAFAKPWIQEEAQAVVTASVNEDATILDRYDLNTGLRTASVALPDGVEPWYIESTGDHVYVLAMDTHAGIPVVLRWNWTLSPVTDETVYTGQRYTAENPDSEGIAQCAALAREIGNKYGIQILVGPDAALREPWDYDLEMEYQVSLIRRELDVLAQLLSLFPDGFIKKLPGDINLCLVRSITGSAESGSLDAAGGIQFWAGEEAYVAFAAGDALPQTFFHEMFHIIDSKVLSVCRVYYHWENLNPEGCEYFSDYTSYLTEDVSQYLGEEDRVFIDAYSMCYPREDRARIMEYACMEGNSHYFQSETMQNKLKTLCEGIRKAFGLENYQEPLLWEQYLAQPLKMK